MKINVIKVSARLASGATSIALFAVLLVLSATVAVAGVGITSAPARVAWDVGSYTVAGTNTSDIVGNMWVSNTTAGGAAISLSRSGVSFVAQAIALQGGKNYITVYGTNAAGDVSSDTFNIWRYNIDGSGQQAGSKYGRRLRGMLVGWGDNWAGQTICPSGNDFVAVAAGYYHSLALRSDGTLIGWGGNPKGQTNCPSGNYFVAVAAGSEHSLALHSDGTLVGWGYNNHGQTNCPIGTNFVAVAAGEYHSLALRSNGTLVGWGGNGDIYYGQTNCPSGSNFVAVAAGAYHSLALRSDGSVVGWGYNGHGQTNCPSGNDFVAVAAGGSHSLALRSDGKLVGWGYNGYGQTNCPGDSTFVALAAGGYHSMALRSDGTLVGWGGSGSSYQGQTNCPCGTNFVAVAAGEFHSLSIIFFPFSGVGITGAPARVAWDVASYAVAGTNTSDIDGDMSVSNATLGGAAISFSRSGLAFVAPAIALQIGKNYICVYATKAARVVSSDTINIWRYNIDGSGQQSGSKYGRRWRGRLVGWGSNGAGQINCPAGNDFVAVAAGGGHSLALRNDGTLVGWGDNEYGLTNCPSGNDFVAVAAGYYHSLALRSDSTLVGWGQNDEGQTNCPSGNDFVAVAGGEYHSLALRSDGTLVGWGNNQDLQINCPNGSNYIAVAAGLYHSLALRSDGTLVGWGNNEFGQAKCPSGNNYVAVAAGECHSLALRRDGTLVGWGWNYYGLTNCPSRSNFVAVGAGGYHSQALRRDGTLVGWGDNGSGNTNCPSGNGFVAMAAGYYHSLAIKLSPLVDITNADALVSYDTTRYTIGGTNSPLMGATNRVVGTMWWSNALNSAEGTFPVAQIWSIGNIPLNFGTNVIGVCGTNVYGWLGYDSVIIKRSLPVGTQIGLVAPIDNYLTNQFKIGFNVGYGDAIVYKYLATNSTPVFDAPHMFPYTTSLTFNGTGSIYWTALGYDSGYIDHWAFETNRLTIQKTLTPGVHLVAPATGTRLTNVFACKLIADYGAATVDRQLSIINAASWFAYDAENPVVFNNVGTYRWTARGRTEAGWWYAPETNTLIVTTNYSGGSAIFLVEPADDSVATNFTPSFRVLTYGAAFAFAQVAIDNEAFETISFPTNIELSDGQHQWTARGGVLPGPVYTYAPATNTFTVLPEGLSAGIAALILMVLAARRRSRLRTAPSAIVKK